MKRWAPNFPSQIRKPLAANNRGVREHSVRTLTISELPAGCEAVRGFLRPDERGRFMLDEQAHGFGIDTDGSEFIPSATAAWQMPSLCSRSSPLANRSLPASNFSAETICEKNRMCCSELASMLNRPACGKSACFLETFAPTWPVLRPSAGDSDSRKNFFLPIPWNPGAGRYYSVPASHASATNTAGRQVSPRSGNPILPFQARQ